MSEARDTRARPPDAMADSAAVDLSTVVAGMMASLARAKQQMDETSAEIARRYAAHDVLNAFPVPAFSLASVQLRLRFAIESVDAAGADVGIIVDRSILAALPQHLLSEIDIELVPQAMNAYTSDTGDRVLAHG